MAKKIQVSPNTMTKKGMGAPYTYRHPLPPNYQSRMKAKGSHKTYVPTK